MDKSLTRCIALALVGCFLTDPATCSAFSALAFPAVGAQTVVPACDLFSQQAFSPLAAEFFDPLNTKPAVKNVDGAKAAAVEGAEHSLGVLQIERTESGIVITGHTVGRIPFQVSRDGVISVGSANIARTRIGHLTTRLNELLRAYRFKPATYGPVLGAERAARRLYSLFNRLNAVTSTLGAGNLIPWTIFVTVTEAVLEELVSKYATAQTESLQRLALATVLSRNDFYGRIIRELGRQFGLDGMNMVGRIMTQRSWKHVTLRQIMKDLQQNHPLAYDRLLQSIRQEADSLDDGAIISGRASLSGPSSTGKTTAYVWSHPTYAPREFQEDRTLEGRDRRLSNKMKGLSEPSFLSIDFPGGGGGHSGDAAEKPAENPKDVYLKAIDRLRAIAQDERIGPQGAYDMTAKILVDPQTDAFKFIMLLPLLEEWSKETVARGAHPEQAIHDRIAVLESALGRAKAFDLNTPMGLLAHAAAEEQLARAYFDQMDQPQSRLHADEGLALMKRIATQVAKRDIYSGQVLVYRIYTGLAQLRGSLSTFDIREVNDAIKYFELARKMIQNASQDTDEDRDQALDIDTHLADCLIIKARRIREDLRGEHVFTGSMTSFPSPRKANDEAQRLIKEVEALLQEAETIAPEDVRADFIRGALASYRGFEQGSREDLEKARATFTTMVTKQPSDFARLWLMEALIALRDFEQARTIRSQIQEPTTQVRHLDALMHFREAEQAPEERIQSERYRAAVNAWLNLTQYRSSVEFEITKGTVDDFFPDLLRAVLRTVDWGQALPLIRQLRERKSHPEAPLADLLVQELHSPAAYQGVFRTAGPEFIPLIQLLQERLMQQIKGAPADANGVVKKDVENLMEVKRLLNKLEKHQWLSSSRDLSAPEWKRLDASVRLELLAKLGNSHTFWSSGSGVRKASLRLFLSEILKALVDVHRPPDRLLNMLSGWENANALIQTLHMTDEVQQFLFKILKVATPGQVAAETEKATWRLRVFYALRRKTPPDVFFGRSEWSELHPDGKIIYLQDWSRAPGFRQYGVGSDERFFSAFLEQIQEASRQWPSPEILEEFLLTLRRWQTDEQPAIRALDMTSRVDALVAEIASHDQALSTYNEQYGAFEDVRDSLDWPEKVSVLEGVAKRLATLAEGMNDESEPALKPGVEKLLQEVQDVLDQTRQFIALDALTPADLVKQLTQAKIPLTHVQGGKMEYVRISEEAVRTLAEAKQDIGGIAVVLDIFQLILRIPDAKNQLDDAVTAVSALKDPAHPVQAWLEQGLSVESAVYLATRKVSPQAGDEIVAIARFAPAAKQLDIVKAMLKNGTSAGSAVLPTLLGAILIIGHFLPIVHPSTPHQPWATKTSA